MHTLYQLPLFWYRSCIASSLRRPPSLLMSWCLCDCWARLLFGSSRIHTPNRVSPATIDSQHMLFASEFFLVTSSALISPQRLGKHPLHHVQSSLALCTLWIATRLALSLKTCGQTRRQSRLVPRFGIVNRYHIIRICTQCREPPLYRTHVWLRYKTVVCSYAVHLLPHPQPIQS